MILCFKLSMPNVSSWNGKWTGKNNQYLIIKNFGKSKKATEKARKLLNVPAAKRHAIDDSGYYYYNFGDGWGAGISVSIIDSTESRRLRRQSAGFYGYDWMVDSIIDYGDIYDTEQRKEQAIEKAK